MTKDKAVVNVLVPTLIDKTLTYQWQGDVPPIGTLVRVPLRDKVVTGCVWNSDKTSSPPPHLRRAEPCYEMPSFSSSFVNFLEWVAHWTYNPRGLILKMALGGAQSLAIEKSVNYPQQEASSWELSEGQKQALLELTASSKVALLDGVTGSGKTLVYMEAMASFLARDDGGQILVLLPEIALLKQWVMLYRERFGAFPHLWHSGLTKKERAQTWHQCARGEARVLVGMRSALFVPMKNLSLVIVDEEHDGSYKQEQGVIYHGRDMAIVRGAQEQARVFLVSATPSLETLRHVQSKKYEAVSLQNRFKGAFARLNAIDMRTQNLAKGRFISPFLEEAMRRMRGRGRQCLLFLNRRGYAPLTLCRSCGHRVTGAKCDNWLVWHQYKKRMICHHCGREDDIPAQCPACGDKDSLIPYGIGVDRLEEEARELFEHETIEVMSSDRLTKKGTLEAQLQRLHEGRIGIVIGTQMIAKGHHFPQLGLVGVVDGDFGLASDDVRASERCYQMLHQVGGRAGREHQDGEIYIQTYNPDHEVMKALLSYKRDDFVLRELEKRQNADMPPFGRLASVIVSSKNEERAREKAHELKHSAPCEDDVRLFGPAPCPIFMIAGRARWRILLWTRRTNFSLAGYVRRWLGDINRRGSVSVIVDIDPIHFL